MTDIEEIKRQLSGYLPELYADDDPAIAPALVAARRDPVLSHWLDGEIAFDRRCAESIATIEPPAGSRRDLHEVLDNRYRRGAIPNPSRRET